MSEVSNLEKQRSDAVALIERGELARKLYNNPDFKKLILDEFCVQECARYAQLSGDPSLPADGRADALGLAQAAGHLRRWLSVVVQIGNQQANSLADLDNAIQEARQEGGD